MKIFFIFILCTLFLSCSTAKKNENVDDSSDSELSDVDTVIGEEEYTDEDDESGIASGTVCTGQAKCYDDLLEITCPSSGNDFYGQDAQYRDLCSSAGFVVTSSEKGVADSFTGLFWQRGLPDIYEGCTGGEPAGSLCLWQEAIDYCKNLEEDGFSDWRLPAIVEISTLPDYGKSIPAIDQLYFPETIPDYFWSSTVHKGFGDYSWVAYFNDGNADRFLQSKAHNVRCVRGRTFKNNTKFIRETFNGEYVLVNERTNFMWADTCSNSQTWKEALKYCQVLVSAGFSDWRLPNVNELKTLLDYSLEDPATTFPSMPSQPFWSSTTYSGYSEYGWYVSFMYGEVYYHTKSNFYHAKCVR